MACRLALPIHDLGGRFCDGAGLFGLLGLGSLFALLAGLNPAVNLALVLILEAAQVHALAWLVDPVALDLRLQFHLPLVFLLLLSLDLLLAPLLLLADKLSGPLIDR